MGTVKIQAAADVAPLGTAVDLRIVDTPDSIAELDMTGSPVFDLVLGDGMQPQSPIRVEWTPPSDVDPTTVAFITDPGGGQWAPVPTTVFEDGTVVAHMDHLSWGWFADARKLVDSFVGFTSEFLGQSYPEPQPCVTEVEPGGSRVKLTTASTAIHACLGQSEDTVELSIQSNSPYVWLVKKTDGVLRQSSSTPSTNAIITELLYNSIYGSLDTYSGFVAPGFVTTLTVDRNEADGVEVRGSLDAGLGLVPVLVSGVDMALTVSGVTLFGDYEDYVTLAQCVFSSNDLLQSASAADASKTLPSIIDCGMSLVEASSGESAFGPARVVLALVGSLSGQLVTQVRGMYDSLVNPSFTVQLESNLALDASTLLTFRGAGPIALGSSSKELIRLGLFKDHECGPTAVGLAEKLGIHVDPGMNDEVVTVTIVDDSPLRTEAGAGLGTTFGDLRKLYGQAMTDEIKDGNGGPFPVTVLRDGALEMVFVRGWDDENANPERVSDHERVTTISVREASQDMYGGC
ncbi:MAG: hypothetical protein Q4P15_09365 [Propionibacteriaceae bacterium]|nr:hypothetical protein [Propionibacteriaceae bacterium]